MAKNANSPASIDLVRLSRAFLMLVLVEDAVKLRPDRPRCRGPLTPLAEKIYRLLLFQFENALTGLCFPSIATIAKTAGCAESSVKLHLLALSRTEFLTWRPGKRKRVLTRAGWRVVRAANHYRMLCPERHLAGLRRFLLKACNGQHGPLIQAVVSRFTPPTEEEKAAVEMIAGLAADLRGNAERPTPPTAEAEGSDPPSQGPPAAQGGVEIAGMRITDPKLGSVLSELWAAMEQRERPKK